MKEKYGKQVKEDMEEATIFDVARVAGVSKTTVSRVINNSDAVTEKTREKVKKVMAELKYTPSAAARTLSLKRSNVIGVIFPDSSEYFFGQMLKGIIKEADKHSMVVVQCNSYHDQKLEAHALEMIAQQRVRGLVITPVCDYYNKREPNPGLKNALMTLNVPVVFVDRSIRSLAKDSVLFDNYRGGFLAAEKFAANGIKKIGAIVADKNLRLGDDRLRGFMDGLSKYHLTVDPECLFSSNGPIDSEEVSRLSRILLDRLAPGGGIFLSNGFLSKFFLREVFARNLVLGKEIHCIAFDRIELLDTFTNLSFSYIDRSEEEMGKYAAQMLLERINGMDCPVRKYIIPAKIHVNDKK